MHAKENSTRKHNRCLQQTCLLYYCTLRIHATVSSPLFSYANLMFSPTVLFFLLDAAANIVRVFSVHLTLPFVGNYNSTLIHLRFILYSKWWTRFRYAIGTGEIVLPFDSKWMYFIFSLPLLDKIAHGIWSSYRFNIKWGVFNVYFNHH